MSIVLERNNSGGDCRIEPSGFVHHSVVRSTIFDSPESSDSDQKLEQSGSFSSSPASSASSIGKNSDDECSEGDNDAEVQSEFKRGPLDSLDALEEVLPVKKSISKFYCGKSKSYTSLSDAACSSINDITKPENAYTRKRKNLLAFNNFWDKNQNSILRGRIAGLSKRPSNSRSMLSFAANMNCSGSSETSNSKSSSPIFSLPPLPPNARKAVQEVSASPVNKFPSWRTLSLSDLQGAAATATPDVAGLWMNKSEN